MSTPSPSSPWDGGSSPMSKQEEYVENDLQVYKESPSYTPRSSSTTVGQADETPIQTSPPGSSSLPFESKVTWVLYRDDHGRPYYFNSNSQLTQWEEPIGYNVEIVDGELLGDEGQDNADDTMIHSTDFFPLNESSVVPKISESILSTLDEKTQQQQQQQQEEEEKDPTTLALEKAQEFLLLPDAILEPSVLQHVNTLVSILGGQVGGVQAITSIVQGYIGQSTLCGLFTQWIFEYQREFNPTVGQEEDPTKTRYEIRKIQSILEKVLIQLTQSHFNKKGEETILNLPKNKRDFLKEMMEFPEWRRLLIQLSETNIKSDSALLTFCLQTMSELGFHREITKYMTHGGDYFRVFHNMLIHDFVVLGTVSGMGMGRMGYSLIHEMKVGHDRREMESSHGWNEKIHDLQRNASRSTYTLTYTMVLLHKLIDTTQERIKSMSLDSLDRNVFIRARNTWQRLCEELEEYMIKPNSHETSSDTSNAMMRKRRANVALALHEVLQKSQIRPTFLKITEEMDHNGTKSIQSVYNAIESGILSLIKRYSMGMPIDDHLVDQLLHNPFNSDDNDVIPRAQGGTIGMLLAQSSLAISSLMEALFLPGSNHGRSKSLEFRMKCAKLLALSVLSAEYTVYIEHSHDPKVESPKLDESAVAKALLQASQLLFDQVENMVSITVIDKMNDSEQNSFVSVGHQLSFFCIQYPIVAKGFLLWATDKIRGIDFASSAAYPSMAPGIMSFARIISKYHPMCRPSVVHLAFLFLTHSNTELSYQKIQGLKEQALRLLLIACTQGLVLEILDEMSSRLRQSHGKIDMDSALIRYFVDGLLDIVRPPLSLPFVHSMGNLLLTKPCIEALNSPSFDNKKKELLIQLLGDLDHSITVQVHGSKFNHSTGSYETALMNSLKLSYLNNKK